MLPDFFLTYTEYFQPLNLFKYITFRSIGALLTALLISFIFGPKIIALLKKMQKKGQPIRSDGPKSHILFKTGTPTMGGLLILLAFTTSTILWAKLIFYTRDFYKYKGKFFIEKQKMLAVLEIEKFLLLQELH